jgi:hypothetical protein
MIQRLENWPLYQVFSSIFLKAQKKRIIRICLNRIERMSLLWGMMVVYFFWIKKEKYDCDGKYNDK